MLRLIHSFNQPGDILWRAAQKKLTFDERLNAGLGCCQNGTLGSGIGKGMAEQILQTAKEIYPGLHSGPHRISHMTSIILKEEFHAYTRAGLAEELGGDPPTGADLQMIALVHPHVPE